MSVILHSFFDFFFFLFSVLIFFTVSPIYSFLLTNIFYFTADGCQPCKKIKPMIQEINKDRLGLKFHMIDADIEKELIQRFKIQSLPTFIIINQGKEIQRLTGSQTKEKLQEFLTFAETGNHEKIVQKDL